MNIILLFLLLTNVYDLYATSQFLGMGGGELNPVADSLILLGGIQLLAAVKIGLILPLFLVKFTGITKRLLIFTAGIYGLLTAYHVGNMV